MTIEQNNEVMVKRQYIEKSEQRGNFEKNLEQFGFRFLVNYIISLLDLEPFIEISKLKKKWNFDKEILYSFTN